MRCLHMIKRVVLAGLLEARAQKEGSYIQTIAVCVLEYLALYYKCAQIEGQMEAHLHGASGRRGEDLLARPAHRNYSYYGVIAKFALLYLPQCCHFDRFGVLSYSNAAEKKVTYAHEASSISVCGSRH